ncbi:hypothetical protein TNCV_1212851 [Trichonephila clavipes]|nr:hypothetical protein TNCV_1212851 [Trichonephila clavipes]
MVLHSLSEESSSFERVDASGFDSRPRYIVLVRDQGRMVWCCRREHRPQLVQAHVPGPALLPQERRGAQRSQVRQPPTGPGPSGQNRRFRILLQKRRFKERIAHLQRHVLWKVS